MAHQLHLISFDEGLWKLDDHTIKVGRRGLAEARAALGRSHRPYVSTEADISTPAAA